MDTPSGTGVTTMPESTGKTAASTPASTAGPHSFMALHTPDAQTSIPTAAVQVE
jgi:hypothetical protein